MPNDPYPVDVVDQALSEITSLHRDKPNFRAFITAVIRQMQPFIDACQQMMLWRDIDEAEGDALLQIAEIVGAPIIPPVEITAFIGFDDQSMALPMWDDLTPEVVGGRWRDGSETGAYSYEAQRVVIRAEILKNQSHGYTPEIQESVALLFSAEMAFVENNKDMSFDVNVGTILTPIEIELINDYDILPRPAGVQIKNFVYWNNALPVFGFAHQSDTFGFGVGYFAFKVMPTTSASIPRSFQ